MTPDEQPGADDVGTFHAESASPATPARARPATPRGQARSLRSQVNRAAHASKQAARDLRRAAGRLPVDDPHRAAMLEAAEQQERQAEAWQAARPPVPPRPASRRKRR